MRLAELASAQDLMRPYCGHELVQIAQQPAMQVILVDMEFWNDTGHSCIVLLLRAGQPSPIQRGQVLCQQLACSGVRVSLIL